MSKLTLYTIRSGKAICNVDKPTLSNVTAKNGLKVGSGSTFGKIPLQKSKLVIKNNVNFKVNLGIQYANGIRNFCSSSSSEGLKTAPEMLNQNNLGRVFEKYDNILLDCDGVLWSTDHYTKFENIGESMQRLRDLNKNIMFITNNSMHARQAYVKKFKDYGGFHADVKDIYAVSYVAALYLKHVLNIHGKCYLIGTKGMRDELSNIGIEHIGYGPDLEPTSDHVDDLLKQTIHENVAAVLVGFDCDFGYNKLFKATSYLMDEKCHYVVTNDVEVSVKLGPRHRQPITGAIVAAVSTATRRKPQVIGKPHHHLLECIQLENPSLDLEKTIMIGDSMFSDIHFANNSGIDSALVLSGASDMSGVQRAMDAGEYHLVPKFILPHFNNFGKYL